MPGGAASEIGPPEPAVFVAIEHDEVGLPCACFVTRDGDSFALHAADLELRIVYLEQQRLESSEERRALRMLVTGV